MFIVNCKLNAKKILLIGIIISGIILLAIEGNNWSNSIKKVKYDYTLNEENFTEILKSVHNNLEENIDKTIQLSGFIFTLPDFKPGTFVCGRNYIFKGEEKVVGFMCEFSDLSMKDNFDENDWVEITGVISEGYYVSKIPIIRIAKITKIDTPNNTYVAGPN